MSGGFPIGCAVANANDQGTDTANSRGTTITLPGTADTLSAWVQLVASTPYDSETLIAYIQASTGVANFSGAVDIGVGAAGSEQVIAQFLNSGATFNASERTQHYLPIGIPAGSRIAARAQVADTTGTARAAVSLVGDEFTENGPFGGMDTIGFQTAQSNGINITAPTTPANTKGSWQQLTASTAQDYAGFALGFDIHNDNLGTVNFFLADIGIGAGGSEQVIVPNIALSVGTRPNASPAVTLPFMVEIPAGTRIAARTQCNLATTPGKEFGLTFFGFYL